MTDPFRLRPGTLLMWRYGGKHHIRLIISVQDRNDCISLAPDTELEYTLSMNVALWPIFKSRDLWIVDPDGQVLLEAEWK